MRYTVWLILITTGFVVVFLCLVLVAIVSPLPFGARVLLPLGLGLLLLVGWAISVVRMRRAMDEYGGTPMGGLLGAVGFDIEPDDEGDSHLDEREREKRILQDVDGPGPSLGQTLPTPPASSSPKASIDPPSVSHPDLYVCPNCGAVTEGEGTRFCRTCKAMVRPGSPAMSRGG